jgi:Ca-activated chloride channel family protein
MTLLWPMALLGLLAIPLGAFAYVAISRHRTRYAVSFSNLEVLRGVAQRGGSWRRRIPLALFVSGFVVLLVALARPHASLAVPREDATIVLVMDASSSMLANDVEPSRFEAARESAQLFVDIVPSTIRVGVVAFSDTASVVRPATTNHGAVLRSIEALSPRGGTAMGDGLGKALGLTGAQRAAPEASAERRSLSTVLLLSDGRNNAGRLDPLEAAARAEALHVSVSTIALGTGARRASSMISTSIDPPDRPTLREIAQTTGGRYFSAANEDRLRQVYEGLGRRIGYVRRPREVTSSFAAVAAVLLMGAATASMFWRSRFP